MADTKTYTLTCLNCEKEFQVDLTPEDLGDDGEVISCPACDEDQEWEYDAPTDTLTLLPSEEEEDEGDEGDEDEDDEEDDAE